MIKDPKVINYVEQNITYIPDDNERILSNEIIYYYRKFGIFKVADFISYFTNLQKVYSCIFKVFIVIFVFLFITFCLFIGFKLC